ncbi:MAG TPA: hypothetical protein VNJ04_04205 [Gemmatimonadaceae bacterium]|nr:hypothetical protein [Gemmatimonadaceae bacterium]
MTILLHDLHADDIQWNLAPLDDDAADVWPLDLPAARARIIDLERDFLVCRMWFRESLHALHLVTRERDRLKQTVQELRESLHGARAA